jgi:putative ABC transport system substrate-binding protein
LNYSREFIAGLSGATLSQLQARALQIMGDSFFRARGRRLAELAARYAIPSVSTDRGFTLAGGLMNYGPVDREIYRLVGSYTGRILNGEKPADLPVQQSTKVELIINLKTAKALGLTIPETLLATADEVVQ